MYSEGVTLVLSSARAMVSAIYSSQNLFLVVSPFACLITMHEYVYRSWPALQKPRPIEEQENGNISFLKFLIY